MIYFFSLRKSIEKILPDITHRTKPRQSRDQPILPMYTLLLGLLHQMHTIQGKIKKQERGTKYNFSRERNLKKQVVIIKSAYETKFQITTHIQTRNTPNLSKLFP